MKLGLFDSSQGIGTTHVIKHKNTHTHTLIQSSPNFPDMCIVDLPKKLEQAIPISSNSPYYRNNSFLVVTSYVLILDVNSSTTKPEGRDPKWILLYFLLSVLVRNSDFVLLLNVLIDHILLYWPFLLSNWIIKEKLTQLAVYLIS